MILFYCIAVGGMLFSMQHRCQRKFEESNRPTFAELERRFEIENQMLDRIIVDLLSEHRMLASGTAEIPEKYRVSDELAYRFYLLEKEIEDGKG